MPEQRGVERFAMEVMSAEHMHPDHVIEDALAGLEVFRVWKNSLCIVHPAVVNRIRGYVQLVLVV